MLKGKEKKKKSEHKTRKTLTPHKEDGNSKKLKKRDSASKTTET